MQLPQLIVGIGVLALAAALGLGASQFAADSGYAGIGPAFFPWLVTGILALSGLLLIREAASGGFRAYEADPPPAEGVRWHALVIASAGLLLNAALIRWIGFTLSCALLFACVAVAFGSRRVPFNLAVGVAVSWPVFLMFNRGLGLNLPSLFKSGWL